MTRIIAETADEWRDVASRSFVPLSFQRAAASFSAEMDRRSYSEGVSLASIRSEPLVIERTQRLATASMSNDIHISLQVSARGRVVQENRVTAIGPGVLTITETNRPFLLDYSAPRQSHIVLQISRRRLGVSDEVLRRAGGRQIAGPNPARDAYIAFITAHMALDAPLPNQEVAVTEDLLCSLAGAMIRSAFDHDDLPPLTDEAAYAEIVQFVAAHLTSRHLTPDSIASAHFLSRRRLYTIFEKVGTTPTELIRAERIALASELLSDPGRHGVPIADIAFSVGFSDLSTFARTFRRQTGMTPRDWRTRA